MTVLARRQLLSEDRGLESEFVPASMNSAHVDEDMNDRPYAPPTEQDFDPPPSQLDAQVAWRNFGGLHLDEAYAKFCEDPPRYQEDFMFMGGAAFAFYFPVLDRYLRETCGHEEDEDSVVRILAQCIEMQFLVEGAAAAPELCRRILRLCGHVRARLVQYASTEPERAQIDEAWARLEDVAGRAIAAHGPEGRP